MNNFSSSLHCAAISGMDGRVRGSPIMRVLLVIVCLTITALLLRQLTRPRGSTANPTIATTPGQIAERATAVPFSLFLSSPARLVSMKDPSGALLFEKNYPHPVAEIHDQLKTLPSSVVLAVQWDKLDAAPRYFAKLQLDPPGRDSLTHVFDSTTNIDDIWELP